MFYPWLCGRCAGDDRGHPILALFAAMAAVCVPATLAFLQTKLGVESILAVNYRKYRTYTVNLAAMGSHRTFFI